MQTINCILRTVVSENIVEHRAADVGVGNGECDFVHISHSEVHNCRPVMVMTSSVLGQIIFKIRPHDKWWSGQPLALIIIDLWTRFKLAAQI